MVDDAGMPQPMSLPMSHAPDADLDTLVTVLAARLQDAGTALLARAFRAEASVLRGRRRVAIRQMAAAMIGEAEAADHCYAKGEVSAHITDGPATEAPCCT